LGALLVCSQRLKLCIEAAVPDLVLSEDLAGDPVTIDERMNKVVVIESVRGEGDRSPGELEVQDGSDAVVADEDVGGSSVAVDDARVLLGCWGELREVLDPFEGCVDEAVVDEREGREGCDQLRRPDERHRHEVGSHDAEGVGVVVWACLSRRSATTCGGGAHWMLARHPREREAMVRPRQGGCELLRESSGRDGHAASRRSS
jgi:hypothetical protein